MQRKIPRRLTSAHVLAALALFIALGGSALAVSKNSIKSKHVKDASITGADVRDDALTGADVDERSLRIDVQAANDGGPPSGPAGGALAGEFPNPSLAAGSVAADQITDDAVGAPELSNGSVGAAEVADDSLLAADLGANSVGEAEIASNAVDDAEVASNAIDSTEVEDGTLNGDDVGRESGTVNDFDPPSIGGGVCTAFQVNLGVPDDMRNDAITVSMDDPWSEQLTVLAESGDVAGTVELNICNRSAAPFDQTAVDFFWVAFDV
jgi:hypothetical protein